MEPQLLSEPAIGPLRGPGASGTPTIEVVYGSQTGNTERVATRLGVVARASGLTANITELNEFGVDRLASATHVLVLTSTYNEGGNEGDMPDNAALFWQALASKDAPRLDDLRFAVLALGDESYFDFCQAGLLIDERMGELGAERMADRVDCDAAYEERAEVWISDIVALLADTLGADAPSEAQPAQTGDLATRAFTEATLIENRALTSNGSANEVRHYELDLSGTGISYTAGDSIAVQPVNDPALASAVMAHLELDPDEEVAGKTLEFRLLHEWELRTPSQDLVAAIAAADPAGEIADVLAGADREKLTEWLCGRDVLDLLETSPSLRLTASELAMLLRPLQPRQFSISSSPRTSPERASLTVATVRYGESRAHGGAASTYLADRVSVGQQVKVLHQPNAAFSLPSDDVDVIMIGPGTGVAPFRGFLLERAASQASGRNWLFFGSRHEGQDFLYREELTAWTASGLLSRLDLAFSRDQDEKEYVQTRMLEQAAELYSWLENGAYLFVCGDAERMAADVERALLEIIASQRGGDLTAARSYLDSLVLAKRYVRDIY